MKVLPDLTFFLIIKLIVFLRFLYFDDVQLDENIALKLLPLADKYLQNDLADLCHDFLIENMNWENVFKILDFARLENIQTLKNCSLKFIKQKITVSNICGLIIYLEKQSNPAFLQENLALKDKAFNFIIDNFAQIYQNRENNNLPLLQEFLIKSVEIETIIPISSLVCSENYEKLISCHNNKKLAKEVVEKEMSNLRGAVYRFTDENFEKLKEIKIARYFSQDFLLDFVSYQIEAKNKLKNEHLGVQDDTSDTQPKKGRKRMEPGNGDDGDSDENPTLKKTKKSP